MAVRLTVSRGGGEGVVLDTRLGGGWGVVGG